ncbi:MAG: A/G-specific adenine glycosylase [Ruminococcaceae bacterium]|nr:A/G-specific adenine glycosylase [Oscillospiraceae bacterium]
MDEIYRALPGTLLPWYHLNHRQLPWRGDKEPYHIWLSEIMLQQTRVEAVRGYYTRFLDALPTIEMLADADDELLHKLWEGLGYYSRVRNLKKAANVIMRDYDGVFPRVYDNVLSLPGIGPYTAGAICSIAFGQPTPAVDGNVLRVISRLTDDDTPTDTPHFRKNVERKLASAYPKEAGDFTQALMELGATVCGPNRAPDCTACPCKAFCKGKHRAIELPKRTPKRPKREEERTVFVVACGDRYALTKRPEKGLLAGLWQFPDAIGAFTGQKAIDVAGELGFRVSNLLFEVEKTHIFTHIVWKMRGIYLQASALRPEYTWLTMEEIRDSAALPTAYRQFFEEIFEEIR